VAANVRLWAGKRFIGYVTVFDAEPSEELLMIAFPDAIAYVHDERTNRWTVDLGEAPAPRCDN